MADIPTRLNDPETTYEIERLKAREKHLRHRCYMDGIDWQHHLEADAKGTPLFPSEKSLRREKTCLPDGCGVVEVEVRLIRWVEEQDLDRGEHGSVSQANKKDSQ